MQKELLGTNPDGSPHYSYVADEGETLIATGKIVAVLTMGDGTKYDVSDAYVSVPEEHHDELVMAIGDYYEEHGHPDHQPTPEDPDPAPFVHDRAHTRKMLKARKAAMSGEDDTDEEG